MTIILNTIKNNKYIKFSISSFIYEIVKFLPSSYALCSDGTEELFSG